MQQVVLWRDRKRTLADKRLRTTRRTASRLLYGSISQAGRGVDLELSLGLNLVKHGKGHGLSSPKLRVNALCQCLAHVALVTILASTSDGKFQSVRLVRSSPNPCMSPPAWSLGSLACCWVAEIDTLINRVQFSDQVLTFH